MTRKMVARNSLNFKRIKMKLPTYNRVFQLVKLGPHVVQSVLKIETWVSLQLKFYLNLYCERYERDWRDAYLSPNFDRMTLQQKKNLEFPTHFGKSFLGTFQRRKQYYLLFDFLQQV